MSTATTTRPIVRGDRVIFTDRQGTIVITDVLAVERYRGYDDPSKVITFYRLDGVNTLVGDEADLEVVRSVSDVI